MSASRAFASAQKVDTRTIMLWDFTGDISLLCENAKARNISVVLIAYSNARSTIPQRVIVQCSELARPASQALAGAHRTFALVCNRCQNSTSLRTCYRTLCSDKQDDGALSF